MLSNHIIFACNAMIICKIFACKPHFTSALVLTSHERNTFPWVCPLHSADHLCMDPREYRLREDTFATQRIEVMLWCDITIKEVVVKLDLVDDLGLWYKLSIMIGAYQVRMVY